MNFISWQFVLFVAVVFALYYAPALRGMQVALLVAASMFFFAWADARFLPLLLIALLCTQACLWGAMRSGIRWMVAGVAANLALLAFFKYKFLFVDQLNFAGTGIFFFDYFVMLPLPIGISFFVFHNISLLVDYTKNRAVISPPPSGQTMLYILFFPQLVCGPITRARGFFPQIEPKRIADVDFIAAAKWIVAGLFMKSFCANNLNEFTIYMETSESIGTLGGIDRLFLLGLFSIQIYADFFGYSAMAIGLALLFGYRLPVNFRLPYLSVSIAEFWHRWHISLSTWLKNYLYIPLGGNRRGAPRTYFNLLVVMGLGGLWHGSSINFLVWGLYHGILLCLERAFHSTLGLFPRVANLLCTFPARCLRVLAVFVLVSMGWLLFKVAGWGESLAYLQGWLENPWAAFREPFYYTLATIYALPVVLQHVCAPLARTALFRKYEAVVYALLLLLSFVESGPDSAFIYFQF